MFSDYWHYRRLATKCNTKITTNQFHEMCTPLNPLEPTRIEAARLGLQFAAHIRFQHVRSGMLWKFLLTTFAYWCGQACYCSAYGSIWAKIIGQSGLRWLDHVFVVGGYSFCECHRHQCINKYTSRAIWAKFPIGWLVLLYGLLPLGLRQCRNSPK